MINAPLRLSIHKYMNYMILLPVVWGSVISKYERGKTC